MQLTMTICPVILRKSRLLRSGLHLDLDTAEDLQSTEVDKDLRVPNLFVCVCVQ